MKNLLLIVALALSVNVFAGVTEPHAKSLKTFNELFKTAENVKWSNTDGYNVASFVMDRIVSRAIIDSQGNLIRTMRYYDAGKLPAHILYNIKQEYRKQNIWGVTEVSNKNGIMYTIVLNDAKNWYYVNANTDGELSLTKKLKNASK